MVDAAETTMPGDDDNAGRGLRIMIAGTGGQGVILSARLLTSFFVERGRHVVSGQLHGMAQRGGAVQSTVIVDHGDSPALPRRSVDFLLGLEPIESARALPYLSERTTVFMNTAPIAPFILAQEYVLGKSDGTYPDVARLTDAIRATGATLVEIDATELARRAGSVKTVNVVMLGCLFGSSSFPYAASDFESTVISTAPVKLQAINVQAFRSGVETLRRTGVAAAGGRR